METEDNWTFYKDGNLEWRWVRKAANGEVVGASTEGYKRKRGCLRNAIRNGFNQEGAIEWVDKTRDKDLGF